MKARTVEYIIGIMATVMISAGLLLYALDEPQRVINAQAAQLNQDLDEAMTLYAQNCAVCHGLAGEGIATNPALNSENTRQADAESLYKTVARGVINTAMPAWSQEDGGPLSDYQVGELVTLLQAGDWQAVQDRVVNLGLAPLVPFTAEADPDVLEAIRGLPGGEQLSAAVELYADNCVACHGPDGLGTSLAPALNDPAVRQKTPEEIQRVIVSGVPSTLMAGWEKVLPAEETAFLVELVLRWEEIPQGAIPAPDQPVPVTAESLELGSSLYAQNCSRCHGPEGQGSQRAPALNVQSFLTETKDPAVQQIITMGVPGTSMPVWGDRMTDAQIQAVVGFLRSWEPAAPAVAQPVRISGPWWATSQGAALPSGGAVTGNSAPVQESQPAAAAVNPDQAAQSSADAGHTAAQPQGNPPWLQELQVAWYEQLDWQAVILLTSVVTAGMLTVLVAVLRLRKLSY